MVGPGLEERLGRTRFGPLRWVEVIDSTNRRLLEEARRGAPEGVVLVADHQTAGRGRLGRRWVEPPGSSLLCSVLLRPRRPPEEWHTLTVALALAARTAIGATAGVTPDVKWPNDLEVGQRKVAGILAEAFGGPTPAVVLGIGINVNWPRDAPVPPDVAARATSLSWVAGRDVDRAELAVRMLEELDRLVDLPAGDLRNRLAGVCSTLGRRVRIELADWTFVADAVDLDDTCALVVRQPDGTVRTVEAADVVHLRALDDGEPSCQ